MEFRLILVEKISNNLLEIIRRVEFQSWGNILVVILQYIEICTEHGKMLSFEEFCRKYYKPENYPEYTDQISEIIYALRCMRHLPHDLQQLAMVGFSGYIEKCIMANHDLDVRSIRYNLVSENNYTPPQTQTGDLIFDEPMSRLSDEELNPEADNPPSQ